MVLVFRGSAVLFCVFVRVSGVGMVVVMSAVSWSLHVSLCGSGVVLILMWLCSFCGSVVLWSCVCCVVRGVSLVGSVVRSCVFACVFGVVVVVVFLDDVLCGFAVSSVVLDLVRDGS